MKMKRLLSLLSILLLAASMLFALDGTVTWVWYVNDYDVEYYRYQLDGEDDDNWTVVGWDVNEVTLELDVSVVHTLYLQQSRDGVTWSESSMTDSEVYEEQVVEETPQEEEEELLEEETPVVAEPEVKPEPEPPVQEEVPGYSPIRRLDVGAGYMNSIPNQTDPKSLGLFASYSTTFMKVGVFDVGVKANLSMYTSKSLFMDIGNTRLFHYLNGLAMVTTAVGNCEVFGAFGPEIGLRLVNDTAINAGLALEVGLRYHRFPNLSLGLSISDHYYLIPYTDMVNRMDIRFYATKHL